MIASAAAQRIRALRDQIRHHDYVYYGLGSQEITDVEYDELYAELQSLESANPELITPDSPTQRVGGASSGGFPPVHHQVKMLSIDDIRELEESDVSSDTPRDVNLIKFYERLLRSTELSRVSLGVEPKIDGVAVAIRYINGALCLGATRGIDGVRGEDITPNVRTIRTVPLSLPPGTPQDIEVRGEVYIQREAFAELNDQREGKGLRAFANPRNAAAGSLSQLNPLKVSEVPLSFIAHGMVIGDLPIRNDEEMLALLERLRIPKNGPRYEVHTLDELRKATAQIKEQATALPFPIDGVVIKVTDYALRASLGETSRAPRWAAAYKFVPEQVEATVQRIVVQVGRSGVLTPVAELSPVFVSGSTVARATLHNFEDMAKKDVREGDHVLIEKAGEIIPAVVRVLKQHRPAGTEPFPPPRSCPSCGSVVKRRSGEVALRCDNDRCPDRVAARLVHFSSKTAMDIEGLGDVVARELVRSGMVHDPLDLFELSVHELAGLKLPQQQDDLAEDGPNHEPDLFNELVLLHQRKPSVVGNSNAKRIIDAIGQARLASLGTWLHALGIPGVGRNIALELGRVHQTIEDVASSALLQAVLKLGQAKIHAATINPNSTKNPLESVARRKEIESRMKGTIGARREELKKELETVKQLESEERARRTELYERELATIESKRSLIHERGISSGIGPSVAESVLNFFASRAGQFVISRLAELNIRPGCSEGREAELPLDGRIFVITGTLEGMTREQARKAIGSAGGKLASSVSSNTDYVVRGDAPSASKLKRAEELDVEILTQADFEALVRIQRPPARNGSEAQVPSEPELPLND